MEQSMNDPRQPVSGPATVRPVVTPRPTLTPRNPAPAPARAPSGDDPITLVEDVAEAAATTPKKIVFGPEIGHKKHDWRRQPKAPGTGACRVRSFHGKLSEQGLEYLDDSINEWLDAHPEIEVKFVSSTIGMFDGKMKDLAVILNLWY
jgi:hypothetical protein